MQGHYYIFQTLETEVDYKNNGKKNIDKVYKVEAPLVSPHPYILQRVPSGMEQPSTGS